MKPRTTVPLGASGWRWPRS